MAAYLLIAIGVFAVICAFADWDWFMNHRKARFLVSMLGRGGARIFYGLLGAALITLGVLILLGVVRPS